MNQLYPLKFKPILKERIWGGYKLANLLNKIFDKDTRYGESWELSTLEGSISVVSNGFLEGNDLHELIEIYMGDLVGDHVYEKFGDQFPLLVKIIDAEDLLSIQVHPDDELAFLRHDTFGKTELWHVLQAEEKAEVINGFKENISRDEFLELLASSKLKSKLNSIKPKAGDSFFIPAGRVHCVGGGVIFAEIQQASDVTYRIYDWNRVDEKGNSRELHLDLALDTINYSKTDDSVIRTEKESLPVKELINSPWFVTNMIELNGKLERDYNLIDSFVIYLCAKGEFRITVLGEDYYIKNSETVLIPAILKNFEIVSDHGAKILEVFIRVETRSSKT
jgi:mannose-6-phosphate isomerase